MERNVISVDPRDNVNGDYLMARYNGINNLSTPAGNGLLIMAGENNEDDEDDLPLDLTESLSWRTYTVRRGDSVSRIAQAHALSMDAIIASNNITNARHLREGEVIRIPNMDGVPYTVKRGDTLSQISISMGVPLEVILDANNIQQDVINPGEIIFIPGARMRSEDLRMALGEQFLHPVRGARLTSPFGWRNDPFDGVRRHHAAVDLAAPVGTLVRAAMDGEIIGRGFNSILGNFVIIRHSSQYQTLYAHLDTILVRNGERVRQGAQIGTVGNTGRSTGPHLHFMVYRNGRAVNPLDYFRI
jgi:murein DD-endopeptidase MepM/ murein hydrolase activator NlpD